MDALVIGAGPAGLMAAEALAAAGRSVVVAEARPSPARKFLMAGKSGLNLTKNEPPAVFAGHFSAPWMVPLVTAFGPAEVVGWARDLGIETFTGSSGRVFPRGMKASPLLRAWLARLGRAGVRLRTRWAWRGFAENGLLFETPEGPRVIAPRATVLALGGASWPRLGSDAAWVPWLGGQGVAIRPFRPANVALAVDWSAHMARHFGAAVKGVALLCGAARGQGEFVISARGLEGGGIYAVSAAVRDGAPLAIDLLPGRSVAEVAARLARTGNGESIVNRLRKALRLDPAKIALAQEWARPLPVRPEALAGVLKALPVHHAGPRPIAEAISSAGGIARAALTEELELTALPGVFACGEMLDWEAPTGGYLLTGCLASGLHVGRAASAFLARLDSKADLRSSGAKTERNDGGA
ncbi:MAG: TIGR03862 family flavoprotein [Defluviimonas sp.]|uniref:TIGR03862 family flavoprotein n=1 Tax=Albidovulum sp. TaxID=1872424 RepID=UPI001D45B26A|nr:TIGR03862 family flavoprotein [Paracoccaceae bacterium]MCC0062858.1 TIGR03862 family flavoprotein [Defluviimonas sp.]